MPVSNQISKAPANQITEILIIWDITFTYFSDIIYGEELIKSGPWNSKVGKWFTTDSILWVLHPSYRRLFGWLVRVVFWSRLRGRNDQATFGTCMSGHAIKSMNSVGQRTPDTHEHKTEVKRHWWCTPSTRYRITWKPDTVWSARAHTWSWSRNRWPKVWG